MLKPDMPRLGGLEVGGRQEVVDLPAGLTVDDTGEEIGAIVERLDVVEFADLKATMARAPRRRSIL